jgi:oxygen-independent coproporphyrinogen III oxidase
LSSLSFQSHRANEIWDYLPDFASQQLPRYTSYPPANRFSGDVDGNAARTARARLAQDATISLYLHIPFCKKLCWYCGCHTSVPTLADPVDAYIDALRAEIALVARDLPLSARVTRIHFGGGSPDILLPRQVDSLFSAIKSSFQLSPVAEIAVELDPRGISPELVQAFVDQGLSRASLGVQVLSPDVQARINRIQPRSVIENAIRILRDAGVEGINIDMMYGLPGQTLDHVVETAMFASAQDADRIAVFGYAHVPWMKKHQKGIALDALPSSEARFRQAEAASRALTRAGYLPIGFDHFAAPGDPLSTAERQGKLHRNFQGYTEDDCDALIGLGASAISSLPDLFYQNTAQTDAYRSALAETRSPVVRGLKPTASDRRTGSLIERILCDFEANIEADRWNSVSAKLAPFISAGLVRVQGNHMSVTARGKPYVRNVAACFDPDHLPRPATHSLAI